MMLWFLPAAVAVLAAIPVLLAVRRLAAEALATRRELDRFSELRPALVALRDDTRALRVAATARLPRR
jgi:hypothetical protein